MIKTTVWLLDILSLAKEREYKFYKILAKQKQKIGEQDRRCL